MRTMKSAKFAATWIVLQDECILLFFNIECDLLVRERHRLDQTDAIFFLGATRDLTNSLEAKIPAVARLSAVRLAKD